MNAIKQYKSEIYALAEKINDSGEDFRVMVIYYHRDTTTVYIQYNEVIEYQHTMVGENEHRENVAVLDAYVNYIMRSSVI